jgi:hypothetical protein
MVSDNNDDLQKEVSQLGKKIESLTEKIEELNKMHTPDKLTSLRRFKLTTLRRSA